MKRVLIVEDDSKIGAALAVRLKNARYETLLAHDALSGVSTAVRSRPDLVLLDISMPAGSGFTVAERIQTLIPTATPSFFLPRAKRRHCARRQRDLAPWAILKSRTTQRRSWLRFVKPLATRRPATKNPLHHDECCRLCR
jgi:CheY-like chemotaxis protein